MYIEVHIFCACFNIALFIKGDAINSHSVLEVSYVIGWKLSLLWRLVLEKS